MLRRKGCSILLNSVGLFLRGLLCRVGPDSDSGAGAYGILGIFSTVDSETGKVYQGVNCGTSSCKKPLGYSHLFFWPAGIIAIVFSSFRLGHLHPLKRSLDCYQFFAHEGHFIKNVFDGVLVSRTVSLAHEAHCNIHPLIRSVRWRKGTVMGALPYRLRSLTGLH
jgi:hypothetical protein